MAWRLAFKKNEHRFQVVVKCQTINIKAHNLLPLYRRMGHTDEGVLVALMPTVAICKFKPKCRVILSGC